MHSLFIVDGNISKFLTPTKWNTDEEILEGAAPEAQGVEADVCKQLPLLQCIQQVVSVPDHGPVSRSGEVGAVSE